VESQVNRQSVTDSFVQEPASEVDVLWIIDDSVSMAAEQEQLADDFTAFAASLDAGFIDYHLGVVTTDMDPDNAQAGVLRGQPPVLVSDPDTVALFQKRVIVGTDGSGKEKGLAAAVAAVSEPLASGQNAGFLRDDATLLLVFVTDEEDCSDGNALDDEPPEACYSQGESLVPVADLHAELVALKGGRAPVIAAGILGTQDGSCTDSWPGLRYEALIDATGGISGDICNSDYAGLMDDLGLTVQEIRTVFQLNFAAVEETLEVSVGEVIVTGDPIQGWTYDAEYAAIRFDGEYVPPRDSTLSVTYEVAHGGTVPDLESP
jgi:hypothetical protein